MTDVVDADELLRRIQRARACAAEEERAWHGRAGSLSASDPDGAREAAVRARAYEAVRRVLDEIVNPGRAARSADAAAEGPAEGAGVKQVT
ncbi:hypothetical protein [Streptomyces sp. NPDC127190]|uniref:hypothetical protein n=1 Tax=unclassified Streptomyces TaxID=2593676 RepID=UPI003628BEE4